MKAKSKISQNGQTPDPRFRIKGPSAIPAEEEKLLKRPLSINDPPDDLSDITQTEIVAFTCAAQIFRLARADFEQKRAALVLKLLRLCHCEEGSYFALLDEHDRLVIEDHTSLEMGTGRPIMICDFVPSGGAV